MAWCGGCDKYSDVVNSLELEVAAYADMILELDNTLSAYDSSIENLELAIDTCSDCLSIGGVSPYAKNIKATISKVSEGREAVQAEHDNTERIKAIASSKLTYAKDALRDCRNGTCDDDKDN